MVLQISKPPPQFFDFGYRPPASAVLNGEKKKCSGTSFPKKARGHSMCSTMVGGGWWLVIIGWWRLAVVGSWRLVAAGGWRRLVVGGWWRLVVGGWWRLAVDGSWWLAVGGLLGRSLGKKKIWFLNDRPAPGTSG